MEHDARIERIVLLDFIHRMVSQKSEAQNIYTKIHNSHVKNSHKGQLLTTEPLTWVHTQHKLLKQVRHRWQQMTPTTAHFNSFNTNTPSSESYRNLDSSFL
jgi:hypothetical protein